MRFQPTLEEAEAIAATQDYDVVPLSVEILSDFITPIEALRVLKHVSDHCFLLESATANETWGRYTFLGFNPSLLITCKDGVLNVGERRLETDDPAAEIRKVLACHRSPRLEYLPPFTGGLMGYFAFEYLGYAEPLIRSATRDDERFNDLDLMLFDTVIAFDHIRQKIVLMHNMRLCDLPASYAAAKAKLEDLVALLRTGKRWSELGGKMTGAVEPLFEKERFCAMVREGKRHIREGDVFQIVLSNRLSAPFEGSLFNTYRMLRTVNPSPYMFYLSGSDVEVAGASPETLVKLEDGVLHTFPLAGTRPRGKTPQEDAALKAELLADEKELAEHDMLVDLGRNDLGRVSRFGSVKVEKLHSVERFSHVMHLGSTVAGTLDPTFDALDAILAVLPAGTLSGAPKIRACQLIGEIEGVKRGLYGGAIGYVDFTGNMDTCIAIRLAYKKNGRVWVRSGAGVVADSVPDHEFEEVLNKARASLTALELAQTGDI